MNPLSDRIFTHGDRKDRYDSRIERPFDPWFLRSLAFFAISVRILFLIGFLHTEIAKIAMTNAIDNHVGQVTKGLPANIREP